MTPQMKLILLVLGAAGVWAASLVTLGAIVVGYRFFPAAVGSSINALFGLFL
jgi:hypothetical protein